MRTLLLALTFFLFAHTSIVAQPADCSDGGVTYDDGSFENGAGWNPSVARGSFVMRFDVLAGSPIQAVCLCWQRAESDSTVNFDLNVWAADGPNGTAGTLIGKLQNRSAAEVPFGLGGRFYRYALTGIQATGPVYIGPSWAPDDDQRFYVCLDESPSTPQRPMYGAASFLGIEDPPRSQIGVVGAFPDARALGIRAIFGVVAPPPPPPGDPPPPAGPWLTTSQLPGYQFKVRINGSALGTQVADCVPETLCVAGAIPTRAELFLRIIGPRPNGFLWDQVIRFTTSRLEVWVQRLSSGQINYYDLPAVPTDSTELPGLVDREAFTP